MRPRRSHPSGAAPLDRDQTHLASKTEAAAGCVRSYVSCHSSFRLLSCKASACKQVSHPFQPSRECITAAQFLASSLLRCSLLPAPHVLKHLPLGRRPRSSGAFLLALIHPIA